MAPLPATPQDGWVEAYLHRPDCARAQSMGGMVSDEEALAALGRTDMVTVACPVCRPDTVLQARRPRNDGDFDTC
ncbi:hypothetical protein GCM10010211_36900 [Streptomyces albospinus]|uniref:Uncharacterized protein n=1 Tax=Streptomyces albospinus TaxID=285515 RepID=A0ABQ2V752_9ACTN|nr:DUF6233 domain-containing protein [Streptomyces albospinus]GGU68238.1 hypothetical protein GCM10010211_36900 [Streptomyces albospinus]